MTDQYLLTPYYMDRYLPGLDVLAQATGCPINQLDLPSGKAQERMAVLYEPVAAFVASAIEKGRRPVSLAGDCPCTIGVIAGLQRSGLNPLLVWFDAHGDFNTWETTPSGFLGGMPLAMLVGRGEQTILKHLGVQPLDERQVYLTDARDLDPGERIAVESSGIHHFPDVKDLLGALPGDRPLYVHFDTDILDPKDAPAMNYIAPGGPSVERLRSVFEGLAGTGRVAAASLSSWNPALDPEGNTRRTCMNLLDTLLKVSI